MRFYFPDDSVGAITFYGLTGGCQENMALIEELGAMLQDVSGFANPIREGGLLEEKW